jgi:CHAT domain-containing protein
MTRGLKFLNYYAMVFLLKTGQGSPLSSMVGLFCIMGLVLLPDIHPFVKPYPPDNESFFRRAVPSITVDRSYFLPPGTDELITEYMNQCHELEQVSAKKTCESIYKAFAAVCAQMESLVNTISRSDCSSTEKSNYASRFNRFYAIALKVYYRAKDIQRIYYYMEQSKLLHDPVESAGSIPVSLKRLQRELLKQDQQYLSYFEDGDSIYALLVSGENITCKKIDFPGYSDTVQHFNALCADRELLNAHYDTYSRVAGMLYQKLIAPMDIQAGNLLVSPGRHFIPFDALTTDRQGRDFLLYHFAISYTQSATRQFRMTDGLTTGNNDFLGIAPECYSPEVSLPRLFGAVQSLQTIEDCFAAPKILSRKTASRKAFLESMGNCSVLHIYSHAGLHSAQPILYLHDNPVYIKDIDLTKKNRLQLVFLAGCETAVAGRGDGPDSYSMADKFVYAGVPSTVATLWQVENKAVYAISESFYRLLKLGVPRNKALQQAKIEFVKQGIKANQMPYYWASIILFGNTGSITPAPAKQDMLSLAAILNISLCAFSRRFCM